MQNFKVGDIVRLTNNPHDWNSGEQIVLAIVNKVHHFTEYNIPIEDRDENFHMTLTIFFRIEDGFVHPRLWGVFIDDVKPYCIEEQKHNFKWTK